MIAVTCKNYGVNEVVRRIRNDIIDYVDSKLKELDRHHNYDYIDNSNMKAQDLYKDGHEW